MMDIKTGDIYIDSAGFICLRGVMDDGDDIYRDVIWKNINIEANLRDCLARIMTNDNVDFPVKLLGNVNDIMLKLLEENE